MQSNSRHPASLAGLSGTVLGIESSCDETAVAIYDGRRGLLAHQIFSQVATHAQFGGVVPELASRDHCRKLIPLVSAALEQAGVEPAALTGLAYTAGPGLIGALLVGATTAVGLAMAWGLPVVPVHHMEAHLLASLLEEEPPEFPFVALLVSGGHTMLVDVARVGQYQVLGQTLDDAAGEAFDKTAKLLGLPYPGGPALAALADKGDGKDFNLPRPMLKRPGLEFSFSGLKTAVMLKVRELEADQQLDDDARANIAAAFQDAVVDTLIGKSARALEQTGRRRLVVAGGVGANRALRERLSTALAEREARAYYPRIEFCTDNGAMIALTGLVRSAAQATYDYDVKARARWPLEELNGQDLRS